MSKKLKILIVKLSAIGDVVHAIPVAYSLRKKFPDAYLSWLVEDRASELIIDNPLIYRVFVLPKQKWKSNKFRLNDIKEFFELVSQLRQEGFDIAIDLQELFKSGLMTYLSGAKRRIAHANTREFADIFINEKLKAHDTLDPERFIIDRYLDAARYLNAPDDEIKFCLPPVNNHTKDYINTLLKGLDSNLPVVVLSPSTTWFSKHWIGEYWSQLIDMLAPKTNIVFVGSSQDEELINRITSGAQTRRYLSLAGKTSLLELAEIFRRANVVVSPDSGPAYIANATEKPAVIVISGSTSSRRTRPHGENTIALSADIQCQPCHKKYCRRKDSPMECMKKLTPDIIFAASVEKLENSRKINLL